LGREKERDEKNRRRFGEKGVKSYWKTRKWGRGCFVLVEVLTQSEGQIMAGMSRAGEALENPKKKGKLEKSVSGGGPGKTGFHRGARIVWGAN